MTPARYFSLRTRLGPPPSKAPAVILVVLAVGTIIGLFADIAAIAA